MIQLRPGEQFTIVRQLDDPFDTTTYYARAVVRNLSDDTVLETINLTDNGSQRFSKAWSVTNDNTGDGRWISITTTIYTDSGYTIKSESYREQAETYLVQERFNPFKHRNLFGGGADVDYKRIKKIIQEELSNAHIEEFAKMATTEFIRPLTKTLGELTNEVENITDLIQTMKDTMRDMNTGRYQIRDLDAKIQAVGTTSARLESQIKEFIQSSITAQPAPRKSYKEIVESLL